jgi:hypothetical protein
VSCNLGHLGRSSTCAPTDPASRADLALVRVTKERDTLESLLELMPDSHKGSGPNDFERSVAGDRNVARAWRGGYRR